LVEFPFGSTPTYGDQVLFELQVQGLVPIVAHPERHAGVMEDPNLLCRWVERGILAQVNAGSLLGQFGRRVEEVARILLEHDLVHFIGSDGHGPRHRPPLLKEAAERAADLVGRDRVSCLVQHWPEAILANAPLDVPRPQAVKRRRRFW
ncbi:MAG: tyrosine protein phosphatase, partial [Anaerolineae bacterium]|nr:tyrosine protein phosphatase [Anaerolineae bacterium]